jgi:Arc/MetJ-type ribon-helix-helix transcriptional regulator
MSTQITIRLPEELVEFVDNQVNAGDAASRAAVVAVALRHERRRLAAVRDAAIYASTEPDEDLNALARWGAAQPQAD